MKFPVSVIGFALTLVVNVSAHGQDHPFTLVNVVDLFDAFSLDVDIIDNGGFTDPGNVPAAAVSRLGTNPASVATDGTRAWIGGYYNGSDIGTDLVTSWYGAIGVAEITNINGGSFPLPLVRYEDTFIIGPAVANTELFSGLDYDESSQTLYAAFDNTRDFASPGLIDLLDTNGSAIVTTTQAPSYVAAIDADTNSLTYTQILWKIDEPVTGHTRLTGGVSIDPLATNYISVNSFPGGEVNFYDTQSLATPPIRFDIFDEELNCPSTALLQHEFDPTTGDLYMRNRAGIQRLPRDASTAGFPFAAFPRFIVEPFTGSNGLADTAAAGDDVQLVSVGAAVVAGQEIVGVGPNGVLDTVPAGDEVLSTRVVNETVVGNTPDSFDNCGADTDGFKYTSVTQGQGISYIESDNLIDLDEDLIIASGRPTFGANQLLDIRFFNTNGDTVANLDLPCTPSPTNSSGFAFYDIDYHAPSGTLVILEFEQRKLFVFRAQVEGGPAFPRFDFTRGGTVDLLDMAFLQQCFTGSEFAGPALSLNCQRLNSDSDCDIDDVDWAAMEQAVTGPPS